jgi:hypothetical protein
VLRGRWTAIAAALAIAGAAAVTAGCGGGTNSQALALDPVSAAATKTADAGAARIRMTMALSGTGLQGKTLRIHMTGVVDGTSGELSLDLGSLLGQTGIPSGADPNATMAQLMHAKVKEIFLEQNGDYVIYIGLGALSSQIPGGKHWIKLDVSKLGKSAGLDLEKLSSGSQLQPTDVLGMLKGEGAKIQKLGSATIGGTATTHYHVTVDTAKALKAEGLASPLLGSVATQMPKLPADVWIGKDGLVRRVALSYGLTQKGQRAHLDMRMDLFDYGANVTIAAPPSNDVLDATQFAQQGISSRRFP